MARCAARRVGLVASLGSPGGGDGAGVVPLRSSARSIPASPRPPVVPGYKNPMRWRWWGRSSCSPPSPPGVPPAAALHWALLLAAELAYVVSLKSRTAWMAWRGRPSSWSSWSGSGPARGGGSPVRPWREPPRACSWRRAGADPDLRWRAASISGLSGPPLRRSWRATGHLPRKHARRMGSPSPSGGRARRLADPTIALPAVHPDPYFSGSCRSGSPQRSGPGPRETGLPGLALWLRLRGHPARRPSGTTSAAATRRAASHRAVLALASPCSRRRWWTIPTASCSSSWSPCSPFGPADGGGERAPAAPRPEREGLEEQALAAALTLAAPRGRLFREPVPQGLPGGDRRTSTRRSGTAAQPAWSAPARSRRPGAPGEPPRAGEQAARLPGYTKEAVTTSSSSPHRSAPAGRRRKPCPTAPRLSSPSVPTRAP